MTQPLELSVQVLENGRRAQVRIPAGFDRANLTPALLATVAAGARVQITAEVEKRLVQIVAERRGAAEEVVADIAHATEPLHGKDGVWAWQPAFDPAAAGARPASGDATNHYLSQIVTVSSGATVARVAQPTDGVDGRSVTGETIPAHAGRASAFRAGAGLSLRPDGSVVATADGVITVSGGVVAVSQVLEIKGCVDFSTGHIDFRGDVVVSDAVRDGFELRATGSVTVHGPVEGATIACAGNLVCPRGIASARRADVAVEGDADIAYLRNAIAVFKGDLTCRGELEHSTITVGRSLNCASGRVIGGTLWLTGSARIGTIGSPDWSPTTVRLGDLPLVAMELRTLSTEAARVQKAIITKEEAVRQLQTYSGGSASSREELTLLQYELSELLRTAAAHEKRRAELQQVMRQGRNGAVHVERVVHPRVRIQHGETAYEFAQELKGPLQFMVDEAGLMMVRISTQAPRPITDFAHAVHVPAATESNAAQLKKCG
ncbi:MAG TPA: FapA family protein [Phycisphaerales bacterium]|nr:FapA family protein [Phycisphaerales bacterium]